MESIDIICISQIESRSINHLVEESLSQGFRFVERLIREYRSGFNCFNKPGEILLAASFQSRSIAIGGLNRDPYFNDPKIGRLWHLFKYFVEIAYPIVASFVAIALHRTHLKFLNSDFL